MSERAHEPISPSEEVIRERADEISSEKTPGVQPKTGSAHEPSFRPKGTEQPDRRSWHRGGGARYRRGSALKPAAPRPAEVRVEHELALAELRLDCLD